MKLRLPWRAAPAAGVVKAVESAAVGSGPMSKRVFLRALVATATGAGLAHAASQGAGATYTAGSPSDTVNTNLTVQGNLVTEAGTGGAGPGYVGVGTTSPAGALDVVGEVWVTNGGTSAKAIDSSGVVMQSYYAP